MFSLHALPVVLLLAASPLSALGAGPAVLARRVPAPASDITMELTVLNNSGFADSDVFLVLTCNGSCYVDLKTGTVVCPASWSFDPATMSASLAEVKAANAGAPHTVKIPPLATARLYFSYGEKFASSDFPVSGPSFGQGNQILSDSFEFASSGNPNANTTGVDFFGVSYSLTLTPIGETAPVTVGYAVPTETIYSAFNAIVSSPDAQQSGNTDIFKQLVVTRPGAPGQPAETIRVIAPKGAGYTDLNLDRAGQKETSHFFDAYVAQHCWKPNRTFSFHDKNVANVYYGRVDATGTTLSIYSNAAMTDLYGQIPRLSNSWAYPFPPASSWHFTGDATNYAMTDIDWGFAISGQAGPDPVALPALLTSKLIIDPVFMAIPVSIARGVMHLDNLGDWENSDNFYKGLSGTSTPDLPIFYYGKILHDYAIANRAYALSFDDVYGKNTSVFFSDPKVTLTLNPMKATNASSFNVLAPCRLLDTRDPVGPLGGPALAAGATRPFDVGGICGIPTDATAVSVNVTVVDATTSGNVVVYPGTGSAPSVGTVNFVAGKTRANNAILGLVGGLFSVLDRQAAGAVHLVVDVNGFFR